MFDVVATLDCVNHLATVCSIVYFLQAPLHANKCLKLNNNSTSMKRMYIRRTHN